MTDELTQLRQRLDQAEADAADLRKTITTMAEDHKRVRQMLERTEADAAALRHALNEIDRQPVGAYESSWGSIEPCDSCGEMRTIAENALRHTAAGEALLAELEAARAVVEAAQAAISRQSWGMLGDALDAYDAAVKAGRS